jgi:deazaflavin-dependent oxidoreductase (nitroreductase family)
MRAPHDDGPRAGAANPAPLRGSDVLAVAPCGLPAHRGGFGLSRPVAGSKFGMLRLTTIGRRSGQSRIAIIGYYDDGPNLVTLAMIGWGAKEPAWRLNLQAEPQTSVELPGETRAVRARAASGEERDRLWAKFRHHPDVAQDRNATPESPGLLAIADGFHGRCASNGHPISPFEIPAIAPGSDLRVGRTDDWPMRLAAAQEVTPAQRVA